MKGAAIFLLDWLVESPEGELVTCPSVSPELSFITDDGQRASADYASTVDIAITRELFSNCIRCTEILGVDPSFRDSLESVLIQLPEYKIGARGQLQEWYHDWKEAEVTHRHLSHLYGLHPGNQISPLTTPGLAEASRRSLELRGDKAVGWSLAWKVCMWARLLDGNRAHKLIENVFTYVEPDETKEGFRKPGTYPNLLGSCPPLILDSNFGYVAGVTEMLLQSHLGEVHLLPALPEIWPQGEVTGLCARGGYVVDIDWRNGEMTEAVIYPKLTGTTTLRYRDAVKQINVEAEVPYVVSVEDFQ
jgi:alpha-L-fucosidase 2